MEKIKVEGMTWHKAGITQRTESEFVAAQCADDSVYQFLSEANKKKALSLAFTTLFPDAKKKEKPQGAATTADKTE